MFYADNCVLKSSVLNIPGVGHAFSTRKGGVSAKKHTKTMNLSFGLGDSRETVLENMQRLCRFAGVPYSGLAGSPQFHSTLVRRILPENALEGIEKENPFPTDALVTDSKGISVLIRTADCVPLLFCGLKEDGTPVVGAAHAGWRGTLGGIAAETVSEMEKLGAEINSIKTAVGQCIHKCCFEVKEDFAETVEKLRGQSFAKRHISLSDGKMFADIVGMNTEILIEAGISENNIDIYPGCTACRPDFFHSHRASGGKRGTMGAIIGII